MEGFEFDDAAPGEQIVRVEFQHEFSGVSGILELLGKVLKRHHGVEPIGFRDLRLAAEGFKFGEGFVMVACFEQGFGLPTCGHEIRAGLAECSRNCSLVAGDECEYLVPLAADGEPTQEGLKIGAQLAEEHDREGHDEHEDEKSVEETEGVASVPVACENQGRDEEGDPGLAIEQHRREEDFHRDGGGEHAPGVPLRNFAGAAFSFTAGAGH